MAGDGDVNPGFTARLVQRGTLEYRNREGTTRSLDRGSEVMELELERRAKSWRV